MGFGNGDAYPQGDSLWGFVGYYNGVEWKNISPNLPDEILNNIWVDEDKKVWVVGTNGSILYYDGSNWTKQESGTTLQLWDIDGINDHNIYAVGSALDDSYGVLLNYNGLEWKKIEFSGSYDISPMKSVWALSEKKVWIAGGTTVYQYNGFNWEILGHVFDSFLCVHGLAHNDVFFGGYQGAISQFNGANLVDNLNFMPGHENSNISDIAVFNNKIYFAGRGGIGFDKRGLIFTATR